MGAFNSTNITDYERKQLMKLLLKAALNIESKVSMPYDENIYYSMRLAFSVIFTLIVSGFGIATNTLNLIVFLSQGVLSDRCNPSLTGLAVSDLCVNVITFTEAVIHAINELDKQLVLGLRLYVNKYKIITDFMSKPYPMFSLITCVVTAYLAFERMISVTFPFHVKNLFTPKRSLVVNGIIFCVIFILYFPKKFEAQIKYTQYIGFNGVGTGFFSGRFVHISEIINSVGVRFISITMVIVLNVIIAYKINIAKRFRSSTKLLCDPSKADSNINVRKTNMITPQTKNKMTKEIKLIRMMSVLCMMLVVCYLPTICFECAKATYYEDIAQFTFFVHGIEIVSRFLQIINSSCNILVYYTMSSKYRQELNRICLGSRRKP